MSSQISTIGAFTQAYGNDALDASVLTIPHVGFLPASDPRMVGTVAAIERGLMRDGFVLRYDTGATKDGLPGSEGAFLACSFWLADNYSFAGRLPEAEALFERLFRAPNAVAQQTQGAGLGLTIALAIVEAHAGTIEVLRSGPEGTTFRMTFPLRSPGA